MGREPRVLREGKRFHRTVQTEWLQTARGRVHVESTVRTPSGRRGRMDVFVDGDDALVAIGEIKASTWDRMTMAAVRRNVHRQARQVWNYIDSQLAAGREVSPGVIFPRRPRSWRRLKLIEDLFEERAIAVVWQDETISERHARAEAASRIRQ